MAAISFARGAGEMPADEIEQDNRSQNSAGDRRGGAPIHRGHSEAVQQRHERPATEHDQRDQQPPRKKSEQNRQRKFSEAMYLVFCFVEARVKFVEQLVVVLREINFRRGRHGDHPHKFSVTAKAGSRLFFQNVQFRALGGEFVRERFKGRFSFLQAGLAAAVGLEQVALDLEFAMSFLSFNFADAALFRRPVDVGDPLFAPREKFLRPLLFNFNRRFGIVSVAGGFG